MYARARQQRIAAEAIHERGPDLDDLGLFGHEGAAREVRRHLRGRVDRAPHHASTSCACQNGPSTMSTGSPEKTNGAFGRRVHVAREARVIRRPITVASMAPTPSRYASSSVFRRNRSSPSSSGSTPASNVERRVAFEHALEASPLSSRAPSAPRR